MTQTSGAASVHPSEDAGVPLSEEIAEDLNIAEAFIAIEVGSAVDVEADEVTLALDHVQSILAEVKRLRALASVSPVPAPTPEIKALVEAFERAAMGVASWAFDDSDEMHETLCARRDTARTALLASLATPQPPREGDEDSKSAELLAYRRGVVDGVWMHSDTEFVGTSRAPIRAALGKAANAELPADWCAESPWILLKLPDHARKALGFATPEGR